MIKKIAVLAVAFTALLSFTGCANNSPDEVLAASSVTFEVPVGDNEVCRFEIPEDIKITDTDATVFWKFDDGSTIYRMSSIDKGKVSSYDAELDVYYTSKTVTKNVENYAIVCSGDQQFASFMKRSLGKCEVITRDIKLPTANEILTLPSYFKMDMQLTSENLYMPAGDYKSLVLPGYTASIFSDGYGKFIENWVMYHDWDSLKAILLNTVTCNTSDHKVQEWYYDGTYFWAKSEKYFVAAKKITQNQYYCYAGTVGDMENFALQGLANIVYSK